jgi:hypothetical protein
MLACPSESTLTIRVKSEHPSTLRGPAIPYHATLNKPSCRPQLRAGPGPAGPGMRSGPTGSALAQHGRNGPAPPAEGAAARPPGAARRGGDEGGPPAQPLVENSPGAAQV